MIESETTELMDYVVYRLPHFGVNRRCDSNEEDPQLCLGRGGVNEYLRDCLSECCFVSSSYTLCRMLLTLGHMLTRDLQRDRALAIDGLGQDRLN